MVDTEYEAAWNEGEPENVHPVESAVKKAAMAKRDAEAEEFSKAFAQEDPTAEPDPADKAATKDA